MELGTGKRVEKRIKTMLSQEMVYHCCHCCLCCHYFHLNLHIYTLTETRRNTGNNGNKTRGQAVGRFVEKGGDLTIGTFRSVQQKQRSIIFKGGKDICIDTP